MSLQTTSAPGTKERSYIRPDANVYQLHAVKNSGEFSSIRREVKNWFNLINLYVYLWPLARFRSYRIRQTPFFKKAAALPYFSELWETISKGSFAYNTFLFRKAATGRHAKKTMLVDLTCLALLFGDEFIDGISNELGKDYVKELLSHGEKRFYLQVNKNENGKPELEYNFDLFTILPTHTWTAKNEKYGIDYRHFYQLLNDLLALMNKKLEELPDAMAWPAANKIKEACDLCFDTYIHDIRETPVQQKEEDCDQYILFHEKKNRCIQKRLLELRGLLLHKDLNRYQKKFNGWLDIISTMQIYDDIQDCRTDENFQDNLLLKYASQYFPGEYAWFCSHKNKMFDDGSWRMMVSTNMPCSVYMCIKLAKDKMLDEMCWTQQKICNYLWKNNWFQPTRKNFPQHTQKEPRQMLIEILENTKPVFAVTGSEAEWKAFALETATHQFRLKKFIYLRLKLRQAYFLYFNFLHLNSYEKARMLDRVLYK